MSNVIQFLEAMGRAPMSDESYGNAVRSLDVDEAMREALLRKDQNAMSLLLGGRQNVMLLLLPADDEPGKDDTPNDDDEVTAIRCNGTQG